MINKKCVYFAADKARRIFIFDEKPSLMVDMEQQTMFGPSQNSPYWVVEKTEVGSFGEIGMRVTRSDFGIQFSQEMFNKITGEYLTFENSPYKIEL